mgnify:CR=1 FL=1
MKMKVICILIYAVVLMADLFLAIWWPLLVLPIPLAFLVITAMLNARKEGVSPYNDIPNALRVFLSALGGVLASKLVAWAVLASFVLLALALLANDESMRRLYRQKGLIVLSGIDGTGKTTHSNRLASFLRELGLKCKVVRFHKYLFLDRLSRARLRMSEKVRRMVESMEIPAKTSVLSFLRPYLSLLDNLALYALKVAPSIWRGEFVVCDRFIWDNYVKYKALGYDIWLLDRLCMLIKPKIGIILDLKPELAVRRVSQREWHYRYTEEHYQVEREEFRRIGKALGFAIISTDRPMEETEELIRNYVRSKLEELKWV